MHTPMSLRTAVGYADITKFARDGYELATFRKEITRFALANSLRMVDVVCDSTDRGSSLADRPGLTRTLTMIESGQVQVLVVIQLEALIPQALLRETILARVRQAGGEVLTVSASRDKGTNLTVVRDLIEQIVKAADQYEKIVFQDRLQAGRMAKLAAGGYAGGRPPYGMQVINGQLVPSADETRTIKLILSMRKMGLSYRSICANLDSMGIQSRSGKSWQAMTVKRIAERTPAIFHGSEKYGAGPGQDIAPANRVGASHWTSPSSAKPLITSSVGKGTRS
jgi:DNA invertase Pin-like site-specific DNA recombinase